MQTTAHSGHLPSVGRHLSSLLRESLRISKWEKGLGPTRLSVPNASLISVQSLFAARYECI